jgi:iron complex outermembrane receptor protein
VGSRFDDSVHITADPLGRRNRLFSAFLQDEISFRDGDVRVTLGTKLEYNDFTGLEIQPSVRLAWLLSERQSIWAAVSRAVRTASQIERSTGRIWARAFPGATVAIYGSDDFQSEELLAVEFGYRASLANRLSLDATLFYNQYDDLRSLEFSRLRFETVPWPPHAVLPMVAGNNAEAHTYGAEVSLEWRPKPWWRARLAYSFLEIDLDLTEAPLDIMTKSSEGDSPEQSVFLQNSFDITDSLDLDVLLRYIDSLPALGVDDYFGLDVRLGWRPRDEFEVTLVGQNLLDSEHFEFVSTFVPSVPTQAQRGVYIEAKWQF